MDALPLSVSGIGAIRGEWEDQRDVADTVQVTFEFPDRVQFHDDLTMVNSFDGEYEMYYGAHSALMLRGNRAWLFKEVDAPLLGWEVNARKETFYKETGLIVLANATKLNAQAENTQEVPALPHTPLYYALENFLNNAGEINAGIEDFQASFDSKDLPALTKYLGGLTLQPHAGPSQGFAATMLALKANEAVVKGQKIALDPAWFKLE
jgi:hypothetical protein